MRTTRENKCNCSNKLFGQNKQPTKNWQVICGENEKVLGETGPGRGPGCPSPKNADDEGKQVQLQQQAVWTKQTTHQKIGRLLAEIYEKVLGMKQLYPSNLKETLTQLKAPKK